MRQQVPLTPGRKRLRALSSLLEAGRGPNLPSNDPRAVGSSAALYHHSGLEGNTICAWKRRHPLPACSRRIHRGSLREVGRQGCLRSQDNCGNDERLIISTT